MKKAILLSSILCVFTSVPAVAQDANSVFGQWFKPAESQYPTRSRRDNNYQYWHQVRLEQELKEREHVDKDDKYNGHDNGHHYAYGKDPKHQGKGYSKNHPKSHGKSGDDHGKHSDKHK
jgi:hypothetical protein